MRRLLLTLFLILGLCSLNAVASIEVTGRTVLLAKKSVRNQPHMPPMSTDDVEATIYDGEMYLSFEKAEGMANIEVINVDNSLEMSLVSTTTDTIIFPLTDYLETGNCTITIETDAGNIYEGQFYLY